jgi:hypothetical protein
VRGAREGGKKGTRGRKEGGRRKERKNILDFRVAPTMKQTNLVSVVLVFSQTVTLSGVPVGVKLYKIGSSTNGCSSR